jgi:hypothetical protein
MSNRSPATITTKEKSSMPMRSSLIQRQCACGSSAGMASGTSEVASIAHEFPIQTKLAVGKPGDIMSKKPIELPLR